MADIATTRESLSFWTSVREALRGSHRDYTSGNLTQAIFLLAVPMVLEMFMESLFAIVDIFWVARLGADSVATVGLVESMLSLVYAVGMGLGMSATAMVARRVGEKDGEGAAIAGVQAIGLGLLAGVAISFGMHSQGVSWGIVIAECSIAVAAVLLFRRGRWKEKKI